MRGCVIFASLFLIRHSGFDTKWMHAGSCGGHLKSEERCARASYQREQSALADAESSVTASWPDGAISPPPPGGQHSTLIEQYKQREAAGLQLRRASDPDPSTVRDETVDAVLLGGDDWSALIGTKVLLGNHTSPNAVFAGNAKAGSIVKVEQVVTAEAIAWPAVILAPPAPEAPRCVVSGCDFYGQVSRPIL